MKKILHLAGMTVRVYRERGAISLLKRIFQYVRELILSSFITRGDVLYISGCPGGSRSYRCYTQAEELSYYGISSKVISQDNLNLIWLTARFKIFIFHRVIYSEHIENVIREIKKQKKTIIFETDDLVFNPAYIPYMHYYQHMDPCEREWYDNGIGREILEDPYITHCVVSTRYLKYRILEKYPDKTIFVSRNKLSKKQIRYARQAMGKKELLKVKDGRVRIGYFSGSRSHDKDFETVSDILLELLKENKCAVLMIVGHLRLPKSFDMLSSQIEYHDFVPLRKLSELILRADINIAPLELDNPFCQAKSELKFFEAGLLEVPTIASATDSFQYAIQNRKNGFLASTREEWSQSLRELAQDSKLREDIGRNAKKDALEKHRAGKKYLEGEKLASFIKGEIKKFSLQKKRRDVLEVEHASGVE